MHSQSSIKLDNSHVPVTPPCCWRTLLLISDLTASPLTSHLAQKLKSKGHHIRFLTTRLSFLPKDLWLSGHDNILSFGSRSGLVV
ncbi:hypothetical protein BaRGS_00020501 [Batillaria attramentaria]|uniref:Uncharacterized protein n=1 Tax=Batillaria attramentaria TaxID=370345 RepID=A0ABD0KM47_9CAEN